MPETCFGCRQPGHRVTQFPYKAANSALAQSIASNRTTALGNGHTTPQNSGPLRKNAQHFGQGHVNHMNTEEVQAATDVVYGEFLVNSTSATVLFDSGTSHSFVSACFVLKNSLRTVLLPIPLLIQTPRAILKCTLRCPRVKIMINGVEFQSDLVVLKTEGLGIILGMYWLKRHHGNISCSDRAVTLTNHNGITVKCYPQAPTTEPMICNVQATTIKEVPVIREYPNVFPKELPKCH